MKTNERQKFIRTAEPERLSVRACLAALLALLPAELGLSLTAAELFPSAGVSAAGLFGLLAAMSAAILPFFGTRIRRWALPAGSGMILLFLLVFRGAFSRAAYVLLNDLLHRLAARTGRIYLDFAAGSSALAALLPLAFMTALMLSHAAVRGRKWVPAAILAAAADAAFTGLLPVGLPWTLTVCGCLLFFGCGRECTLRICLGRLVLWTVCAALAAGLCSTGGNAQDHAKKTEIDAWLHAVRYDDASNSLPEGRLAGLGAWEKNDKAALRVTMEQPEKLYLRGGVYEVYTDFAWEPLPASELAESRALFYWLHRDGFFGQSQLALADSLTAETRAQTVTVENLSACRAHGYLPYAFADPGLLDAGRIGDAGTDAGAETFACLPGSLPAWYTLQREIASAQMDNRLLSYRNMERAYADYAAEKDLQLTEKSWNILHRQLGESGGEKTLAEIQTTIRDYLGTHMYYDEDARTPEQEDFLHYTLERSGAGYSVQYATAAVLMLRYYGVPARYVEGYYLPPEQAAKMTAGECVVLTEENAHAWAEFYLSGVGFVPFEVTPGYVDPEDFLVGGDMDGEGSETLLYSASAMSYAETEAPEVEARETGNRTPFRLAAKTAGLLILLLLLAAAVWILLRRRSLRIALRGIERADDREAVILRYRYAARLKKEGISPMPEDAPAAELHRRAVYSHREITPEERRQMDEYAGSVLSAGRKQWTLGHKLRLRLIDTLY